GPGAPRSSQRAYLAITFPPREDYIEDLLSFRPGLCRILAGSGLQIFFEPFDDRHGRADAVRGFAKTVPFVRKEDVLDRDAPLLQALDRLLGLDHGDVGVVGAVEDDGRRLDAVHLVERRQALEELLLRGRIAVLLGRDGGHPGLG